MTLDEARKLLDAMDTILPYMDNARQHGCACMGPEDGRELCPCDEAEIAHYHIKTWRPFIAGWIAGQEAKTTADSPTPS